MTHIMKRVIVGSSHIIGFEYNASTLALVIEFQRGGRYIYYNVGKDVVEGFDSGKYFHDHIKGRYRYDKLNDGGEPIVKDMSGL